MYKLDGTDIKEAFEQWNTLLYKYAFVRVGNSEIAEDIIQDTFIRAWRHRDLFDEKKSSLKNWLFVIATNLIRDHLRKTRTLISPLDENINDATDIEKESSRKNLFDFVLIKIKKLLENEQELITLRYIQDLSLKETAKILNMNYSAAKVAVHRAMKKLRELCDNDSIQIETVNRSPVAKL
ncbi:RNA polymerase sigma factor [Candidatus Peregrinibacteria bacterium]|nr:RNA polymerase sigma factor [Candidatus Peregrinibacteria bacterium]